ncbi:hypothetical protein NYP18_08985 [Corynebacterium sp. YIM 101645]|uniref:Uncharacterized protein n=1 Tax=Corynebacterium lemuris TaxID=1859292 RepID=A0ABT2FZA1_9CORY|nr:hypothetical protein [Corynebacterium lemuris]MCS5479793.1 hypothetical protein [Corynebacterium lemuris]
MNHPIPAYGAHPPVQQQPPQVDPNNPASVAADILARVSAHDSTAPRPDRDLLRRWAEVIRASKVDYEWLCEGVTRLYSTASEPPKMKLAAVIDAAKTARREARKGEEIRELTPAPSFDEDSPGDTGYAITAAHRQWGAIDLPCADVATETGMNRGCGAIVGDPCTRGNQLKRIPCNARLVTAGRLNNPKHREMYAARQAHLAEHRRTFKPSWRND